MKRFVALLFIIGLVPHIYTNGTTSDSPALGQLVYIYVVQVKCIIQQRNVEV